MSDDNVLIIARKYQVNTDDLLGQGAVGSVFKGVDLSTGNLISVKILRPESRLFGELKEQFDQEVTILQQLNHPNIVKLVDYGEDRDNGGIYFMVTEYKDNTLRKLLNNQIKIGIVNLIRIFKQIALALDQVHRMGVIHGDLKPENILIDSHIVEENGTNILQYDAFIADFGLAIIRDTRPSGNFAASSGNFHYVAPEIILQKTKLEQSDLYALGIMIYEALEGSVPFSGDPVNIINGLLNKRPVFHNIRMKTNRHVVKVMAKALGKNPSSRHKSCEEFINALEVALTRKPDRSLVLAEAAKLLGIIGIIVTAIFGVAQIIQASNGVSTVVLASDTPTDTSTATLTYTPTSTSTNTQTPTYTATSTATSTDLIAPTPTLTETVFAQLRQTINSGNVREGPGLNYDAIAYVGQGEILIIYGSSIALDGSGLWYDIKTPDGERGWVSGTILDLSTLPTFVPTVLEERIPPTPITSRTQSPAVRTPVPDQTQNPPPAPTWTPRPGETSPPPTPIPPPPDTPIPQTSCTSVSIGGTGNVAVNTTMYIHADHNGQRTRTGRYEVRFELTGPTSLSTFEELYPYNFPRDEGTQNVGWTPTQAGNYTMTVVVLDRDEGNRECARASRSFTVTQ